LLLLLMLMGERRGGWERGEGVIIIGNTLIRMIGNGQGIHVEDRRRTDKSAGGKWDRTLQEVNSVSIFQST
jgi:hypothetical protein